MGRSQQHWPYGNGWLSSSSTRYSEYFEMMFIDFYLASIITALSFCSTTNNGGCTWLIKYTTGGCTWLIKYTTRLMDWDAYYFLVLERLWSFKWMTACLEWAVVVLFKTKSADQSQLCLPWKRTFKTFVNKFNTLTERQLQTVVLPRSYPCHNNAWNIVDFVFNNNNATVLLYNFFISYIIVFRNY